MFYFSAVFFNCYCPLFMFSQGMFLFSIHLILFLTLKFHLEFYLKMSSYSKFLCVCIYIYTHIFILGLFLDLIFLFIGQCFYSNANNFSKFYSIFNIGRVSNPVFIFPSPRQDNFFRVYTHSACNFLIYSNYANDDK